MQKIIDFITQDFEQISFEAGETFMWSPTDSTVIYDSKSIASKSGIWSLLHEIGHAVLNHQTYKDDLHLLILEVEAWAEAKKLAEKYNIEIAEEHIETCIDSYRNWLHKRSKCIECGTHSLQEDLTTYKCHNCGTKWKVPASKICKIRRRRIS